MTRLVLFELFVRNLLLFEDPNHRPEVAPVQLTGLTNSFGISDDDGDGKVDEDLATLPKGE